MRYFLFCFFLNIQLNCQAQNDTVKIKLPNKLELYSTNKLIGINPIKYSKGIFITSIKSKASSKIMEILDSISTPNLYYKFYYKINSKLVLLEEGYWTGEGYDGLYKSFYNNGKTKSIGVFYMGQKIGEWKYYDMNGKLVKVETNDNYSVIIGTEIKYPKL